MTVIEYDLTDDVRTIAAALRDGGRLVSRYSSPAWTAQLVRGDGLNALDGKGPTASQAIVDLAKQLRREARS